MPRVEAPLFSIRAWGTLGGGITFKRTRAGAVVVPYRPTVMLNTQAQVKQQASFQNAVSAWGVLPDASKARYVTEAVGLKLSGYLLFIQNYLLGEV